MDFAPYSGQPILIAKERANDFSKGCVWGRYATLKIAYSEHEICQSFGCFKRSIPKKNALACSGLPRDQDDARFSISEKFKMCFDFFELFSTINESIRRMSYDLVLRFLLVGGK